VSGYLCVPETGTYYFWIAGNNHTELNLSSNDNEVDKIRIAHHEIYTSNREWNKFPTQKSIGISLVKGNNYYIEALLKEASFGDNLAVGWRKPSDGDGSEPAEVIPGNVLSPTIPDYVAVSGVSLSPNNVTLTLGEIRTLNATVFPSSAIDRTVSWSSNDTAIVTVDANGMVTAIAEGTATISVETTDGGFTDSTNVQVMLEESGSCSASGMILMERYDDISGKDISNLLNAANYPNSPSLSAELPLFEIPRNMGDNYGVRVSGYLCVPETGIYYFWVAGNNHAELSLSTNDDASNKVKIAHHEDYVNNREWNKFASQKSIGISLIKGNQYYIEALMKEAAFGDNLAVGWRKPSDGDGNNPRQVIPGNVLSPILNTSLPLLVDVSDLAYRNEASITISPNPAIDEVQITLNNLEEEGSEIEYTIYSISGTKVLNLRGEWNETINISRLASGTYQIVARSGSWSASKKLIVR